MTPSGALARLSTSRTIPLPKGHPPGGSGRPPRRSRGSFRDRAAGGDAAVTAADAALRTAVRVPGRAAPGAPGWDRSPGGLRVGSVECGQGRRVGCLRLLLEDLMHELVGAEGEPVA